MPTEIQDKYKIILESVFETEVPVPNVIIEEPKILLLVAPGEVSQFDMKLRNAGLIAAENVTIAVPDDPEYLVTPLVETVGTIPAKSTVTVPGRSSSAPPPSPRPRPRRAVGWSCPRATAAALPACTAAFRTSRSP